MSDIIFVYPKFDSPVLAEPVGICFITSYLKQKFFKAEIDMGFLRGDSMEKVVGRVAQKNPLIIGVTASSRPEFKSASQLVGALRSYGYKGKIIIGGHAISLNAESFLKEYPLVDAIVIGEGELTTESILNAIKIGDDWEKVPGLMFNKSNSVVDTGKPLMIENVDTLPFMDRSVLVELIKKYNKESLINATILNNRGCYGTCSFCSIKKLSGVNHVRCFRQRSMENLVDEIELIIKKYGVKDFYFCSPTFLPNKLTGEAQAEKFNNLLKAKDLNINYFAYLRTDGISEKVIANLKESGMKTLFLGIESFDNKALVDMNKSVTAEQNIEALEILHKFEYSCEYHSEYRLKIGLITFYPGVTVDILKKHIKYVRKYRIPAKKLTYSYEVHDEKELKNLSNADKNIYRLKIDKADVDFIRKMYLKFFSNALPYLEEIRSLQKSLKEIKNDNNKIFNSILRDINDFAYDVFEDLCNCNNISEMETIVKKSTADIKKLGEKSNLIIKEIIKNKGQALHKMYEYRLDRAVNNPQVS